MANIGVEYGSIVVSGVGSNFRNITVNAKYTDTEVDLKDVRNYSFDLKTKYGNISTPNHNLVYQEHVTRDSDKSSKGRMGNANEGGTIKVSAKYGNIKLRDNY